MGGSMGTKAQQRREQIPDSNFTSPDVNAHFRKLDDGKTLFYPLGIFGRRGFVVASTEQETLLRVHARGGSRKGGAVLLVGFLGMIAIGVFTPLLRLVPWFAAGFVAALFTATWVFLRITFRRVTEGMKPAAVPNSPVTYWRSVGQTMHPLWLVFQTAAVVGTAAAYFYLAIRLGEPGMYVFGALMMVLWLIPLGFEIQGWWRGRT
jgi:hypothetical protein